MWRSNVKRILCLNVLPCVVLIQSSKYFFYNWQTLRMSTLYIFHQPIELQNVTLCRYNVFGLRKFGGRLLRQIYGWIKARTRRIYRVQVIKLTTLGLRSSFNATYDFFRRRYKQILFPDSCSCRSCWKHPFLSGKVTFNQEIQFRSSKHFPIYNCNWFWSIQVMIQRHNRHLSISLYISVLAVADTIALILGESQSFTNTRTAWIRFYQAAWIPFWTCGSTYCIFLAYAL